MKNLILLLLIAITFKTNAQIPTWKWARGGGGSPGYDSYKNSCTDINGNTYLTGGFGCCSISFGTNVLTSNSSYDIFIAKYDTLGNAIWAKSILGNGQDMGNAICSDNYGNLYITGYFLSDTLIFDDTTLINSGSGTSDLFIAKYDTDGIFLWAKQSTGPGSESTNGIIADSIGNIYLTGGHSAGMAFDSIVLNNSGGVAPILAKLSGNGDAIWLKELSSGSNDLSSNSIAIDKKGNLYITGSFDDWGMSIPGSSLTNHCITGNCYDFYVAKFDSDGNGLWARGTTGSGNGNVVGWALVTDSKGNLYVTGSFYSYNIVFNGITLTNNNGNSYFGSDMFIVKYDSLGTVLWASRAGDQAYDDGLAIKTDRDDDVYITGYANAASLTFGTSNVVAQFYGGFLAKYSKLGVFRWAKGLYGKGTGITLDINQNVYVSGEFLTPTAVFSPYVLNNGGSNNSDLFLAKLGSSVSASVGLNDDQNVFSEHLLNFPNPFNSSTKIELNSPLNNAVLTIYNLLGQKVKTIQNISGNQLTIERDDLKSGVYFYELNENNNSLYSGKLTIID